MALLNAPSSGIATAPGNYNVSSFANAPAGSYEAQLYHSSPSSPINPPPVGSAPTTAPGVTSPQKATTPVHTAAIASDDYIQKFQRTLQIQNDIKTQADAKQRAQLEAQQAQSLKDLQTADQSARQQGLDIQQLQAQAQADTAAAKTAAAASLNGTTPPATTGTTGTNTGVTTPQGTTTSGIDTSSGTNTSNSFVEALNSLDDTYGPALKQAADQLMSITQGTFPLTGAQQALYASTQVAFQQQIQAQAQANQAYVGTVQETNFRQGGEYTPAISAGNVVNAINYGVQKIAEIDAKMGTTLATLQDNFETKNYDEINKQYTLLDQQYKDKSGEIKTMYDATSAAAKDTRDYNNAVTNAQRTYDLEVKKFDLTQATSALDNKLKTAQIAKIYNDMSTADTSAAADWVKNIQAGTAKLSDVPKALKNAVASGLANGSPQGASGLLDTTKASLDSLTSMVNAPQYGILGSGFTSAVGKPNVFRNPLNAIESMFGYEGTPAAGTKAADFDAKLNQVVNDVVLPNLTILHGLGRVTDREFKSLQSAVTSLSPRLSEEEFKTELGTITDTINQKIADLNSHNGITLPADSTTDKGMEGGIILPN